MHRCFPRTPRPIGPSGSLAFLAVAVGLGGGVVHDERVADLRDLTIDGITPLVEVDFIEALDARLKTPEVAHCELLGLILSCDDIVEGEHELAFVGCDICDLAESALAPEQALEVLCRERRINGCVSPDRHHSRCCHVDFSDVEGTDCRVKGHPGYVQSLLVEWMDDLLPCWGICQ